MSGSARYDPAAAGGAPVNTKQVYEALAMSRLGITDPTTLGGFWTDFESQGGAATIPTGWGSLGSGGTGTVSLIPAGVNVGAGIARYSTGATAASFAVQQTFQQLISNVSTSKGYLAVRMRLNTTPDANSTLMVGLINAAGNTSIGPGFFGGLNANNFVIQHGGLVSGSSLDLGVAKDTAFHVFEMYLKGDGKVYARTDGGSELSATLASPPADGCSALIEARNGATAANQSIDFDWLLIVGLRS